MEKPSTASGACDFSFAQALHSRPGIPEGFMSTTLRPSETAEDAAQGKGALLPLLETVCKSMRQLLNIKLGELDVLVGQDQFLRSFQDETPVSVSEIASRLSIRSSTVSKMTDRMAEKGWAERSSGRSDHRQVLVALTDAGLKVRDAVLASENALEAELSRALGAERQAVAALMELDALLTKRLRRLR